MDHQVTGSNGVVACGHKLEAEAGVEVLRAGGNAVDAAVCMALVGCVVEHRANGIAGYGTIINLYLADRNEILCIDANGKAPALARPDMFEIVEGPVFEWPRVRDHANFVGPLSVSVPGTVAGLGLAVERYGSRPWAELIAPAEHWARRGFPIYPMIAQGILSWEEDLRRYRGSRELLFPNDEPLREGELLVQRDLADLLRRLAKEGYRSFYEGEIAHHIAAYVSSEGGILQESDLNGYQPFVREPLRVPYRGTEVCTAPLPTGGPTVAEILRILSRFGLPEFGSAESVRLLAEVMVRAFRDRFRYLGDPDFVPVDLDGLLSDKHIDDLARDVPQIQPAPPIGPPGGTAHYVAADQYGNIAAITQTHGMGFGSKMVVPGLGIFLGHGMSRFNPAPGFANSIAPGKRPLHNMAPTIILRNGKPWASIGTPGGRAVITCLAQVASNLVDRGMNVFEAIAAPRIHREDGLSLQIEAKLFERVGEQLAPFGYELKNVGGVAGPAHGVQLLDDGSWMAATDPRGHGTAAAV